MPVTMKLMVEQDNDGYLFRVSKPEESGKKKRTQLRFAFSDASGTLKVPKAAQMREYCQDEQFIFSQAAKTELFPSKEYSVFVPFRLFDWMKAGTRFMLDVQRLGDDGVADAQGTLELMINSGNRMVPYSADAYLQYIDRLGDSGEKMAFAQEWLADPSGALGQPVCAMLAGLAQKGSDGLAEYLLYMYYTSSAVPKSGENDKLAIEWLHKAAKKKLPRALAELERLAPPPQEQVAEAEPIPDSVDACMQLAEKGNRDAMFEVYTRLRDDEPAKAGRYLLSAVQAGSDEAVDALEEEYARTFILEGNAERFLEQMKTAAQNGSLSAMNRLFTAYYKGECMGREVKRDKRAALDYLKKSADGGRIAACYSMWLIFEDGNDLLVSAQEAVAYLQKAADSANAAAMNDLGELYVTGRIVEKDSGRGIGLIRKAAEASNFDAQIRVYHMTLEGRYYDVLLDIDKQGAYGLLCDWGRVDVQRPGMGNPIAQMLLWQSYLEGNPVKLTRPQALEYLADAAAADYLPAMFALANADLEGIYKDVDLAQGKALLEKGAKMGCSRAQFALFKLYYTGAFLALTSAVNKERAYKWIDQSSQTNEEAQYSMWELFLNGNEMGLESTEALELLFASARAEYGDSLYATALLFAGRDNPYVQTDVHKAMKYLQMAAEGDHPRSLYKLYEVYSQGKLEEETVEKDDALATRMLLLSAQHGYEPACAQVCRLFKRGAIVGVDKTFALECAAKCHYEESLSPEENVVLSLSVSQPATPSAPAKKKTGPPEKAPEVPSDPVLAAAGVSEN